MDIIEPELRLVIKPSGRKWSWKIQQGFTIVDTNEDLWRNIDLFEEPWHQIYNWDMPASDGIEKSEYAAELAGRKQAARFLADINDTKRVQKHIEQNTTVIDL